MQNKQSQLGECSGLCFVLRWLFTIWRPFYLRGSTFHHHPEQTTRIKPDLICLRHPQADVNSMSWMATLGRCRQYWVATLDRCQQLDNWMTNLGQCQQYWMATLDQLNCPIECRAAKILDSDKVTD